VHLPIIIATLLLYAITVAGFYRQVAHGPDNPPLLRPLVLLAGLTAIALHAGLIYATSFALEGGVDLRFFNAASLIGWVMAALVLTGALRLQVDNLVLVVLPVVALTLLVSRIVYGPEAPDATPGLAGLDVHVISSVLAFAVLNIAVLQAAALAYQDNQLRRRRRPTRLVGMLPPLRVMEDLLFQMLAVGFVLLTISLLSGWLFIDDIFAQHLVHKTTLSVLAWLVFGILLAGRWRYGWRGRMAIRSTLGGFVALLLAYFGTKLVLELILLR
jgi:ABC-type uncharacterized transport system permease subunit